MKDTAPTGADLRDQGVSDALAASTSAIRDHRADIEAVLNELAASGRRFTADDVQERLKERHGDDFQPGRNTVPAVFSAYRTRDLIRCVDYDVSRRPGRHAGILRVWVGVDHSPVGAVAA